MSAEKLLLYLYYFISEAKNYGKQKQQKQPAEQ